MAPRGSQKALSVEHEDHIAHLYFGVRSPSSGAAEGDQGDVRTPDDLIECKMTGAYDRPARSIRVQLSDIEKIADEAWSEGREWALALRIYCPDSPVADKAGYVDMIARPLDDDLLRENLLQRAREDFLKYADKVYAETPERTLAPRRPDGSPWIPGPEELAYLRGHFDATDGK